MDKISIQNRVFHLIQIISTPAGKVTGRTNGESDYSRVASLQIQVSNAEERERENVAGNQDDAPMGTGRCTGACTQ